MNTPGGIPHILTPEEFAERMRKIPEINGAFDHEANHIDADTLICDLLKSLGYREGVQIFKKMEKYYH